MLLLSKIGILLKIRLVVLLKILDKELRLRKRLKTLQQTGSINEYTKVF